MSFNDFNFPEMGSNCLYVNCLKPKLCRVVGHIIRKNQDGINAYCEIVFYHDETHVEEVDLWELKTTKS